MTWVTRARVIPSRRAISAWLRTRPDSSSACHSMALLSSSTTRGVFSSFGGFHPHRGGGALTTRSAATWRATAATSPFLNVPFGPKAISTVCSRIALPCERWWPSAATWTIRNQTWGSATPRRLVD